MVNGSKHNGDAAGQSDLPRSILFVCNQNAVRSPMAHGLADHHCRRRVYVDSVGLIAGIIDGFTLAVMQEVGIDLSGRQPKALNDVTLSDYDLVVALTPQSLKQLQDKLTGSDVRLEYWPTFDPCDAEGSRDQQLESYRRVRDQLEARIGDLFPFSDQTGA